MRLPAVWIGTAALALVMATAQVSAQEPASTLADLQQRVRPGETLWVTSTEGNETRGRLEQLTAEGLTLKAGRSTVFEASRISLIRHRERDSLKNGALIGLGVGGGMAAAWCIGAVADDSGDLDPAVECAEGFIFAGLGTLAGLALDAVVPGKLSVVYRATNRSETSQARLSLAVVPVIAPRRFMLMGVVRGRD